MRAKGPTAKMLGGGPLYEGWSHTRTMNARRPRTDKTGQVLTDSGGFVANSIWSPQFFYDYPPVGDF